MDQDTSKANQELKERLDAFLESPAARKASAKLLIENALIQKMAENVVNREYLQSVREIRTMLQALDQAENEDAREEKIKNIKDKLSKLS